MTLVLTVFATVALSGCGGEEREYASPRQLCGVPVKSALVSPFLPEGKELKQGKERNGSTQFCTVYVDTHTVLSTTGTWEKAGATAEDAAHNPSPKPFGGGRFTTWDRGASAAFRCVAPGAEVKNSQGGVDKGAEVFTLEVHVPTPDEHTEAAMKKFIVPYAKAYREKLPCEGR